MSLALSLASASFLFAVPQAQANPVWTAPGSVVVYPDALFSFGANTGGRTGHGITAGSTLVPTHIAGTRDWIAISADSSHSLAINSAGELWSWGSNNNGVTGLGTTAGNTLVPTRIEGTENNWVAIATGYRHSLALNSYGEIWAWGSNDTGQLGVTGAPIGIGEYISVPTRVGTANDWVYISAGGMAHVSPAPSFMHGTSFAINSAGELWAWGSNSHGQTGVTGAPVGSGHPRNYVPVPTRVGTESDWTTIAVGCFHTLAINRAGEIWAWGNNGSGATGQGTASGNTLVPAQVGTDTGWTAVATGRGTPIHTLAINSAGELWSWGGNGSGATGLGTTTGNTLVPTRIEGTENNWTAISASGGHFSLALNSAGELWSWGHGGNGRTGQGDTANTSVPTRVGTYSNWTAISAGSIHSLAIRTIIEPTDPDPLTITKTLLTPEGTTIPTDMSFDFSFSPLQVRLSDDPVRYSVAIAQVPTITNQTLYLDMTTLDTENTITSVTGTLDLLEILEALTPLSSGSVYVWEVREVAGSSDTDSPSYVTYDTRGFQLRVHTDRDGNLGAIEIFEIIEVENQPPTLGDKVEGMGFTNILRTDTRVQDSNALSISKTTVAIFAPLDTPFSFTLNLTQHSLAPLPTFPITANIIDSTDPNNITTTAANITSLPHTFTLTHNQRLVIPTLPVGTTFSVTEQAHAEFDKSVVVYVGGVEVFEGSASAGNPLPTGNCLFRLI